VGEAGGHGSERDQLRVLLAYGLVQLGALDGGGEDAAQNLRADPEHLPEGGPVQLQELRLDGGPARGRVRGVEDHDELGEDGALPEGDDEDLLPADPAGPLRLALDDHVEAVCGIPLMRYHVPGPEADLFAVLGDPGQPVV
jgi:hypothetical protein